MNVGLRGVLQYSSQGRGKKGKISHQLGMKPETYALSRSFSCQATDPVRDHSPFPPLCTSHRLAATLQPKPRAVEAMCEVMARSRCLLYALYNAVKGDLQFTSFIWTLCFTLFKATEYSIAHYVWSKLCFTPPTSVCCHHCSTTPISISSGRYCPHSHTV